MVKRRAARIDNLKIKAIALGYFIRTTRPYSSQYGYELFKKTGEVIQCENLDGIENALKLIGESDIVILKKGNDQ
jgi:hypothetical protein